MGNVTTLDWFTVLLAERQVERLHGRGMIILLVLNGIAAVAGAVGGLWAWTLLGPIPACVLAAALAMVVAGLACWCLIEPARGRVAALVDSEARYRLLAQ